MFNNKEIIEMCEVLADQENLRVTINESLKCGLLAGCGAVAGGILGGPLGVAIGGTVASVTSAWFSNGKFKSVVEILRNDLTPSQHRRLVQNMSTVLATIRPEDYMQLATLLLTSASLKEVVLKELSSFLLKEMNLRMVQ